MEILHKRCAGIDIGKASAKVCVRIQGSGSRKTSMDVSDWGSMTDQVLALRDYLQAQQVTCIVMEATSDYWKPFYYVLEDLIDDGVTLLLANAAQVKNVPGRKTDVNDAMWLSDLGAHGLVRGSFVPPQPIRELRDLTRLRTVYVRERVREVSRLEKRLETPGIKLSLVASNLEGVSANRMLHALVDGERDPEVLADLAVKRMRDAKRPQLVQALTGRFTDHDGRIIGFHLDHIAALDAQISELEALIEEAMSPFRHARDLLCTIPGISVTVANIIIAETGGDMSVFPTPEQFVSWIGVSPGQYQSANRRKNVKARPGDTWLKGALGISAMAIAKSNGQTYLAVRYRRIKARRGFLRAIVATERATGVAIWHMLTTDTEFHDLGGDHYERTNADRTRRRALNQLRNLGYNVEITKAA